MKKGGSRKAKEGKTLSSKYLPVTGETQILDLDLEKEPAAKKQRQKRTAEKRSGKAETKKSGGSGAQKPKKPAQTVWEETMDLVDLDREIRKLEQKKNRSQSQDRDRKPNRDNAQERDRKPNRNNAQERDRKQGGSPKQRKKEGKKTCGDRTEKKQALDYIVGITGVAVLLVACVTLAVLGQSRIRQEQLEEVAAVGELLENVGVVGETTLLAVADGQAGKEQAAEIVRKEETEFGEYEEKELDTTVRVALKLSSMEKDLKIKFTNKETGKLIPHAAFSVQIKGPDKTYDKTDEDKDGIIYMTGLTPGSYTVQITGPAELNGTPLQGISETVTVKDKIEYKKVDVSDEVKKESEVNASKEDTAVHNTPTESATTDTVEWVESTKTPLDGSAGDGVEYVEVNKSEIPDPALTAGAEVRDSWVRLAGVKTLAEGRQTASRTEVRQTETPQTETSQTEAPRTEDPQTEELQTESRTEENQPGETENQPSSEPESRPAETTPGEPAETTPAEPQKPALESISLSASSLSLKVGESSTLSVSFSPGEAEHGEVSWSSSNDGVAGVSGGSVQARGVGEATITASADGKQAVCTVTVSASEVRVTGVAVNTNGKESLDVGGSVQWSAAVEPGNASNQAVSWKSDNDGVASVDGSGNIRANAAGSANITVTTQDGGYSASRQITVSDPASGDISLSVSDFTMTAGEKKTWKEIPELSYSGPVSGGTIVSSGDLNVASLNDGVLHAKRAGKSEIRIKIWGSKGQEVSKTVTLTVNAAGVDSVTVEPSSVTLKVGETAQLSGKVGTTGYTGVIWESRDESIIQVDSHGNGKIKALKPGKTEVWAHSSEQMDRYAVCQVTVIGDQDMSQPLKDKNGNQLYYKDGNGNYQAAVLSDYSKYDKFYLKKEQAGNYKYTGWQTLDGKTYFFDKNGNKVTGDQIIKGVKYSFGSDGALANQNSVLGIDVSKHNGAIDWNAVKAAGVNYAIIRCGYRGSATGVLVEDPKFKANIQGAINAGLKVGVYFFTQAVNEVEAVEEASMTLSLIKNYKLSYPVFLDVESANGRGDAIDAATRTKVINAYCQTIQNSGYTAGIYANKTWFTSKMNLSALSGYKIWYAQYAAAHTYSGHMDMWQYSCKGAIPGIKGDVDLNISYMG